MRCYIYFLVIICLTISGCASTPEELVTRQERFEVDFANWQMCELAYQQSRKPTFHDDHIHSSTRALNMDKVTLADRWNVKSDLMTNNCRMILGKDYWLSYY